METEEMKNSKKVMSDDVVLFFPFKIGFSETETQYIDLCCRGHLSRRLIPAV